MSTLAGHKSYETGLVKHELTEADDVRNFSAQPAVFVKEAQKLTSPTARSDNERISTTDHGPKPRLRRTVFYVDENPRALRLLTFVLEGCGYKVVTACNSGEVLVGLKQTSCDLVLLAYRRPQTIYSTLLEIKQLRHDVPILLVSSYTLLTPVELIHVNAHVGKGATIDDLLLKIQALIRQTTPLSGAFCSAQTL